jgi:1,2-diacylglycerol-3-alpha-glucose alpha-1,2-galactosyltransferase
VAAACPEYTFVWAGGRPFGMATEGFLKLNKRIAEAGPQVKFPGLFDLDKMPLIYNAADMLLFPSYQENCPLVPIEAAAAGLPVIYRDLKEYVQLYAHSYLKALTRRLAQDGAFRQEAREISTNILSQFEKQHIRGQLVKLYQDVYAGKYSRP